jgi:cystathionine beta-lyase/cystathionine gamma-synthase
MPKAWHATLQLQPIANSMLKNLNLQGSVKILFAFIGIEHIDDLIADLEQALAQV